MKKQTASYLAKKKKHNFQAILTRKHLTNTLMTPTNHYIHFKHPKNDSKT
jgi:hypothetical protein